MIRRIIFGILIMLKTFSITAQTGNEVSGELIVQFANWEDHYNAIYNINSKHNWPLTGMRILNHGWQIAILYYDTTKIERRQLIGLLYNEPQIVNAQSNHRLQLRVTPNDPNYSMQWNMFNDGSGGGIADADIDAAEAWDLVTGGVTANGDTIVIAVVDDGFALNHEDLSFFKNYDEIPLNEIDDDGNGYIDDFDGWNSAEENGEIPSFNHGTHVSGIAGAVGNNGIGVAGVNWNVKILPVRSQVIESQVIASYAYIYEMRKLYDETDGEKGAFIVATNSSFGIDFVFPEEYPLWCAMYDSLGRLGILSAAATNNSMTNIDVVGDMPTGCTSDHMIGVTSTDKADNLKAGYGPVNIDLGAPGSLIESTFPGNTYGLQSGTSMASPHVAGTIALMFDAACEKFLEDYAFDPAGMSSLLKQYLLESVDVLDDLASVTVSGGRLNAYNAINQLLAGYCDTSIDDLPAGGDILVYPNPATSDIQIIGFDEQQQFGELIIWDISGRRIYSSNEFTGDISVADFHEGIYLLQVTDDNSEIIFTSAFIVQH